MGVRGDLEMVVPGHDPADSEGAAVRAGQRRMAAGVMLAVVAVFAVVSLRGRGPEGDSERGADGRTSAAAATAAAIRTAAPGIDPNTATWAELAQLPGIGESHAKAIVDYRDAFKRRAGATGVAFRKPADLEPVPGVGGRMIERMAPWLRFEGAAAGN